MKSAMVRFKRKEQGPLWLYLLFILPHRLACLTKDDFSVVEGVQLVRQTGSVRSTGTQQATAAGMWYEFWRNKLLLRDIPFSNPVVGG